MVIQSNTVSVQTKCCDRIKEACRKTSESAISERWFRLDFLDLCEALAVLCQQLFHILINAEIDQIVR